MAIVLPGTGETISTVEAGGEHTQLVSILPLPLKVDLDDLTAGDTEYGAVVFLDVDRTDAGVDPGDTVTITVGTTNIDVAASSSFELDAKLGMFQSVHVVLAGDATATVRAIYLA